MSKIGPRNNAITYLGLKYYLITTTCCIYSNFDRNVTIQRNTLTMADNERISDTPKHNYKTNNKKKTKREKHNGTTALRSFKAAVKSTCR